MSGSRVPGGVVHKLPVDLRAALITTALAAWMDITPLARNEFICWVDDAKQVVTVSAGSDGRRRSSRRASVGPAAGLGARTATAPAGSDAGGAAP